MEERLENRGPKIPLQSVSANFSVAPTSKPGDVYGHREENGTEGTDEP
jgi:hypothetical protein